MTETKRRIAATVLAAMMAVAGAFAVSSIAADEADAVQQAAGPG